jgi:hypothetical protein
MAALTGKTLYATYKDLLQVSNANAGVDGTLRSVSDGEATTSALKISTTNVEVDGDFEVTGTATLSGLVIGTDIQAWNANLDAVAGLSTSSDQLPYFVGTSTAALTPITTFARTVLDDASASEVMDTLGITTFARTILDDASASEVMDTLGITTFARTILDDASAGEARATLGITSGVSFGLLIGLGVL